MQKPLLEGIRVLDMGRFIAAPYAGQLLADLGAEVVRVERPGPEPDRQRGPYLNGQSLYFVTLNRNKQSVAFEMFVEDGRRLLDQLMAKADILIQNYAPRTARDLGFSQERLLALNPRLIVLSITGYGPDGPDAERVAFDGLAQARSGAMACNGEARPFLNHLPYVDFSTALYGGFGLMAALYERERTGKGQVVEVSLTETVSAFIGSYGMIAEALLGGTPRRQQGNALIFALGDCLPTKDGAFVVFNCIGSMFKRLCEMIGHPELLDDARFATDASRYAHRHLLIPVVAAWTQGRSAADILATAPTFQLPFERVGTVDELAQDPHMQARRMFPRVAQPEIGEVPVARLGVTLSAHAHAALQPAPAIGEHTERVLAEWLDYTPAQMRELQHKGVLPAPPGT
ncbi:Succinyl-CoA--L-malate CoA-transferase alpha subunit [Candidatus Entotheonellaceae bacterium PAL068K]